MSKTTDKINKLATQHEVIGVKTDCKYFSNVGNLCSRVENGMMRCDEYLECEFKYIDALKEENKQMKERLNNCEKFFNELGELLNEEVGNAYWTQAILHKIKKLIKINHELAKEHKTIGQDLYAEIKDYRKEKENLKEKNEKLRTQYNCYACGNCKGKEDYVNLEKHHIGLRKQFDKQNKKLQDIQEVAKNFCNACKEFEPQKSEDKKTCLYCNYGKILGIINDQKESEER